MKAGLKLILDEIGSLGWNLVSSNPSYAFRHKNLKQKNTFKSVCGDDIKILKKLVSVSQRNARFLLNEDAESSLHTMVIAELPSRGTDAHSHTVPKSETFTVLEGSLRISFYEYDNELVLINDETFSSGDTVRIPDFCIHQVLPMTSPVVYVESKQGPFLGGADSKIFLKERFKR